MRFKEAPSNYIIVPNKLWQAVNLSMNAKIVAITLLSKINGKTDNCWPTQRQLSKECHMRTSSVRNALNELVLLQIIEITISKRTRVDVKYKANHVYSFKHSNQWLTTYKTLDPLYETSDPF